MVLLRDPEWAKKSDRWIAERCAVGHPFVAKVRKELEPDSSSTPRTGADGKIRRQPRPKKKTASKRKISPARFSPGGAVASVATVLDQVIENWPEGVDTSPLVAKLRAALDKLEDRKAKPKTVEATEAA